MLDSVGAGHGVNGVGDAGFMGDDLLGAQGDERGVFRGKRESFIKGVVVQGLAAAENGSERLNSDADDVVLRLLRGKGGAGSLHMEAQKQRAWIARAEALAHDAGPQAARGAVLGDLFEQIVMSVEEERKLRREVIDAEASVESGLEGSNAIREDESAFLDGTRARSTVEIAGNRYG